MDMAKQKLKYIKPKIVVKKIERSFFLTDKGLFSQIEEFFIPKVFPYGSQC